MGNVTTNFLQPLGRQFQMPKGASVEPEAWVSDYVEALEGYTDSLLALAAKNIIKNRESRSFPLVAECVKACRDTMDQISEPDLSKPIDVKHDEWREERKELADKLFKCEMGREAVKEGWSWALWDWLRENGRHPNKYEVEKIRDRGMANTRRFWERVNNPPKIINPHFGLDMGSFIRWHRYMTERLRKIVETV